MTTQCHSNEVSGHAVSRVCNCYANSQTATGVWKRGSVMLMKLVIKAVREVACHRQPVASPLVCVAFVV